MAKVESFRDLIVWQRSMKLVGMAYELTRQLPKYETYALGDQLRRAAISIPANIAEGHARAHTKEFLQHLSIARGSLAELLTLILIANQQGYISEAVVKDLETQIELTRKPLWGLINRLQTKL